MKSLVNRFGSLAAASALAFLPVAASATVVNANLGAYSVSYDDSSFLGSINSWSSGGGGSVSFEWRFPNQSIYTTSQAAPINTSVQLPSFTITANPGYALSGAVTGFAGNLSYIEFNGTTSGSITGAYNINGGPDIPVSVALTRNVIDPFSGTYSASATQSVGAFNSISFAGYLNVHLAVTSPTGGLASISSQPQNVFSISFIAAAVPEPESYLTLMAGLALLGAVVRRRTTRS